MPPAPTVRDLQSLIAEQTAALKPQNDLIDQSITSNDASGAAQEAGLTAKKTQAFGDINQEAQNKGMYFAGFSPDQEAKYTAGTYLPALAQLQSTIAQTRASLLGKKADLGKGAFDVATNQHENDLKTLADWNQMTAQQQFQADQATKDRAFQAQQNLLKMQNDNSQAAAARAASVIKPADKKVADIAAAHGFLQGVSGVDNKVSPTTYAQAKALWVAEGYNSKEFDMQFGDYRNSHNNNYKLG